MSKTEYKLNPVTKSKILKKEKTLAKKTLQKSKKTVSIKREKVNVSKTIPVAKKSGKTEKKTKN